MYRIKKGKTGQFHVVTVADNGEPLATSETLTSRTGAFSNLHAQLKAAKTRPGAVVKVIVETSRKTEYLLLIYGYHVYMTSTITEKEFKQSTIR